MRNSRQRIKIGFMVLLAALAVLGGTGCENPEKARFERKLVVNGELKAGRTIDSIIVTWSADITEKYDTYEQLVRNADIRINGVRLLEYSTRAGAYYYPDQNIKVKSGETYRLEVEAEGERVTAETTVPLPFAFNAVGAADSDTVMYVPGTSWFSEAFFTLQWPGYKDGKIFRVVSFAHQDSAANFIEDDRDEANLFKGEEEDRENPAIWWSGEDYIRVNWMFFNWTGWHDITVSAMDQNYYDYRQGIVYGEQSGQNFNNVVKGGYGLFCSSASDSIRIFLVQ